MRYRISKVFHNKDFDVLEITDKKTNQKYCYAFPIQSDDDVVKLKVTERKSLS
jgi:hypothetical protein